MRTFTFILITLISASSYSQTPGLKRIKKVKKEKIRIIDCAQKILLHSKELSYEGRSEAKRFVNNLFLQTAETNDYYDLKTLRNNCFEQYNYIDNFEKQYSADHEEESLAYEDFINTLSNPRLRCFKSKINFDLVLGLGGGFGAGGSKCYLNNGRRFLTISGEFSYGVGLGITLSKESHVMDKALSSGGSPSFIASEHFALRAISLGLYGNMEHYVKKSDDQQPSMTSSRGTGIAVGYKFIDSQRKGLDIKIIPLPRDEQSLLKKLKL